MHQGHTMNQFKRKNERGNSKSKKGSMVPRGLRKGGLVRPRSYRGRKTAGKHTKKAGKADKGQKGSVRTGTVGGVGRSAAIDGMQGAVKTGTTGPCKGEMEKPVREPVFSLDQCFMVPLKRPPTMKGKTGP